MIKALEHELNIQVLTRLGWTARFDGYEQGRSVYRVRDPHGAILGTAVDDAFAHADKLGNLPHYTTDLNWAWKLLIGLNYRVESTLYGTVRITIETDAAYYRFEDATAAMAICAAWIAWFDGGQGGDI